MSSMQCLHRRTKSFPPATVSDCPVTLNEIFDLTPSSHIARDGNRDELPSQRISVCLYSGVQDWSGLRRALAELDHEMEVKSQDDDVVYISGYATRNDYNHEGDIRKIVARYRRVSKSFSM